MCRLVGAIEKLWTLVINTPTQVDIKAIDGTCKTVGSVNVKGPHAPAQPEDGTLLHRDEIELAVQGAGNVYVSHTTDVAATRFFRKLTSASLLADRTLYVDTNVPVWVLADAGVNLLVVERQRDQ